jgi:hypothetical protein
MWSPGSRISFDVDQFRRWADHFGYEFDVMTRVDHERAEEPRTQYRVVFSWETPADETLELGDNEWNIGVDETPETFVEIDEMGVARIKIDEFDFVLDLEQVEHCGPDLLLVTDDAERTLPCSDF